MAPIALLRASAAASAAAQRMSAPVLRAALRSYATSSPARAHHRVLIVGGGTAGITAAAQLRRVPQLEHLDVAIVDPASTHHYQPGWTLVGSGLKSLDDMSRPIDAVIPAGVKHYPLRAASFDPSNNLVKTNEGVDLSYDYLVVTPGLETNFAGVAGLQEALADPASQVSSIYSQNTVEQVWKNIQAFKQGNAIFTQPAGVIKCAGAPQKILWMALSQWSRDGVRDHIRPTFATGAPAMFAVPKYSQALDQLRRDRGVEGLFQHNLVSVDAKSKVATFKDLANGGKEVQREFGFLHVVPPQKAFDWVAKSPLADSAGWVDVDKSTTQHNKFSNVFSIGDASSLPNSKTAAAITSQLPVMVDNLVATMQGKKREELKAAYDGYASCPLLTGHNELMLCEFKYGGVPKETFEGIFGGQETPNRFFYHLKKDFFPWVYWSNYLEGTWFGPSAFTRPSTTTGEQPSSAPAASAPAPAPAPAKQADAAPKQPETAATTTEPVHKAAAPAATAAAAAPSPATPAKQQQPETPAKPPADKTPATKPVTENVPVQKAEATTPPPEKKKQQQQQQKLSNPSTAPPPPTSAAAEASKQAPAAQKP